MMDADGILYFRVMRQLRAERGKCHDCRNDAAGGRRCPRCAERHRERNRARQRRLYGWRAAKKKVI